MIYCLSYFIDFHWYIILYSYIFPKLRWHVIQRGTAVYCKHWYCNSRVCEPQNYTEQRGSLNFHETRAKPDSTVEAYFFLDGPWWSMMALSYSEWQKPDLEATVEKGQEEKRQTLGSKWLHHNSVFDHDTVYCIVQGKIQICPDSVHVRCLENVCPNPLSNYTYFKAGARKRSILLRTQIHYGVSSSCIQIQHAPLALPSNLQSWVQVVTCAVYKILCQMAVCLAERPTWASPRTS